MESNSEETWNLEDSELAAVRESWLPECRKLVEGTRFKICGPPTQRGRLWGNWNMKKVRGWRLMLLIYNYSGVL